MKTFLHKLQEQIPKQPENSVVQHEPEPEPTAQPVSGEEPIVDENAPVKEEAPNEIKEEAPSEVKEEVVATEVNVTETEPMDLDQQSMNNANSVVIISPDDLPHIQV